MHQARRLHAALMPDYGRAAAAYWWAVVGLGGAALVAATIAASRELTPSQQWQALVGCGVAMVAGLFPIRIPGSKNSFVAGEIFVLLQLLLFGPAAATVASAAEAFVGSARSSRRWTSRLISPAAASLSMLLAGTVFELARDGSTSLGVPGEAVLLLLAIGAALIHFSAATLMLTVVIHLKRGEPLTWHALRDSFGWVAMTYAASALVAGLLHAAMRASGIGVMAGALPAMIALLVVLHYHFRQREADEQTQALRIASAEREAAQAARHLDEMRASEQRFHSAFANAAIGMALVDAEGVVLQANPAMCSLFGCNEAAIVGSPLRGFVLPSDHALLDGLWQLSGRGGAAEGLHLRCSATGGAVVHVAVHCRRFAGEDAGVARLIVQMQDVTARLEAEARLQHIAYHDGLTDLCNRARFTDCLASAVARGQVDQRYQFALMYLDFDRFKLINDTLGHSAGDCFLTLVAQRLRALVRPGDTIGRLGGDEFGILIEGLVDEGGLLAMASRLHVALSQPWELGGTEVRSSASIGITSSRLGYDNPEDVLRDADIAMYRAKAAGRARTVLFDAGLRAELAAQARIEHDLPRAIEQGQFSLVYQPIFDLGGGGIVCYEALARWNHPELGPVSPATFIPIAEESASIGALTDWVLNTACAQLKRLSQARPATSHRPRMHVNVSGTDMCRPGFVASVATTLLRHGLQPSQLTLEITETTLMKRLDSALEAMSQLREIGVDLSVDDFGTGYSSLAYLSTLPISSLKVDRSFVERLREQGDDNEVVRAVITLGRALGKTVIAEGIETPEQLARLRAMGCQLGQGYLLARPMTAPQCEAGLVECA